MTLILSFFKRAESAFSNNNREAFLGAAKSYEEHRDLGESEPFEGADLELAKMAEAFITSNFKDQLQ